MAARILQIYKVMVCLVKEWLLQGTVYSSNRYYLLLLLYIHVTTHVAASDDVEILSNAEQNLYHYLFSKNELGRNVRPVLNLSTTVEVKFGIELKQLLSMDEGNQSMETIIWVRQVWKNELLAWNPDAFDGVSAMHVDAKNIWKPDIVLYNNGDDGYDGGLDKYRTLIMINSDGTCSWFAPASFKSTCRVNVRFFPFDIQECKLKFGSWAFDISKIRLSLDPRPVISKSYNNSTQWEVVGAMKEKNTLKYVCCKQPYDDATFKFILKRRPLYYVFHIIAPCIIFMLLILFSFCLPPASGERVSLAITILLVFASFLQVISESLPRTSDSVPILSVFYMTIMAESALSLITTCIVLCFHHKGTKKENIPLPQWMKRYFLEVIPRDICVGHHQISRRHNNKDARLELYGDALKMMKLIEKKNCIGCDESWSDEYTTFMSYHPSLSTSMTYDNKKLNMVQSLRDILGEINKINRSLFTHERRIEVASEWKMIGRILDRVFFYVYLVTFLLSAVGTLLPVYLRDEYTSD